MSASAATASAVADGAAALAEPAADGKGAPYAEGEKVLAYHGPMIYSAKVQKVEHKDGTWRFHLHYAGWSKKWDEWVTRDRLLKDTPQNVAKSERLFKQKRSEKHKSIGATSTPNQKEKGSDGGKAVKPEPKSTGGKGKKRKVEGTNASKEEVVEEAAGAVEGEGDGEAAEDVESLVKIPLPAPLKKQLVDDWRAVTVDGRLVSLPRKPAVVEVLQKYQEAKAKKDPSGSDNTAEVASGLRAYFDRALPAILLYKQERDQYREAIPEGSAQTPSEIYGAEHLLRLFIKLPELLSYVQMEEDTATLLLQKLAEFLKYLQKNQSVFFLSTYDGPKVEIKEGQDSR